jgi:hypothetical protein
VLLLELVTLLLLELGKEHFNTLDYKLSARDQERENPRLEYLINTWPIQEDLPGQSPL